MAYLRNPPFDEKDFPAFANMREQLGFLPVGRRGQSADTEYPGAHLFGQGFDGAALTGRVGPFDGAFCRSFRLGLPAFWTGSSGLGDVA